MGDKGETSLVGKKASKDDLRVETYGTIDELNSAIGLAKSISDFDHITSNMDKIQNDLFSIGAELATVTEKGSESKITEEDVKWLEKISDDMEKDIRPIKTFVLPSGTQLAASMHLARSICRRAERRVVSLSKKEKVNPEIVRYVNRLSDVLFIMARLTNQKLGKKEKSWGPKGILGI